MMPTTWLHDKREKKLLENQHEEFQEYAERKLNLMNKKSTAQGSNFIDMIVDSRLDRNVDLQATQIP